MASVVDIANQALIRVGDSAIISLDDATTGARAVKASWEFVRKEVLRSHPWNCATKRAKLAALATAPVWEYATAYEIPSDCLALLEVDTYEDWRVEGRKIVTDATGELSIRYTKDEEDSEVYDGMLTSALVLRLASEIAERVTNSRTKRETLLAEYDALIREAESSDGHESSELEFEESSWITARY